MTREQAVSKVFAALTAPFRLMWIALTSVANLSRVQVRSLVTVGFLCGMMALSIENWAITFVVDDAAQRISKNQSGATALFDFLTERMRYTSMLQGLIAMALTAVILNADRIRLKLGENEATIGGDN